MGRRVAEQIARNRWVKMTPRMRRWIKRFTARIRRQTERDNPEEAPRRNRYRGWWD